MISLGRTLLKDWIQREVIMALGNWDRKSQIEISCAHLWLRNVITYVIRRDPVALVQWFAKSEKVASSDRNTLKCWHVPRWQVVGAWNRI